MINAEKLYNGSTVMILQHCDGGDSFEQTVRFYKKDMVVPPLFLLHSMIEIAQALAFLHHDLLPGKDRGEYIKATSDQWTSVTHYDLKPENIFLDLSELRYEMPSLRLGDFGHAGTSTDPAGPRTDGCQSPEQLARQFRIGIATDLYPYGIMFFELSKGAGGRTWPTGQDPLVLKLRRRHTGFAIRDFL